MMDLVGHFLLFTLVVIGFLMVPLLLGKLLRPNLPTTEKQAIYECGEPTIGSSYVQYDLRYYVVALLFIIFDVEVAFFFPWAMVYGGATQLADSRLDEAARTEISARVLNVSPADLAPENIISSDVALPLGWLAFADLLVFFVVLLVGFAYVWKRGDLDWVKAVADKARLQAAQRVLARQSAFESVSARKAESTVA